MLKHEKSICHLYDLNMKKKNYFQIEVVEMNEKKEINEKLNEIPQYTIDWRHACRCHRIM